MSTLTRKTFQTRQEGFTLIELLVVLIIIGLLAGMAIAVMNGQKGKSSDSQAKSSARNAISAGKAYASSSGDSLLNFTATELTALEASLTGTNGAGTQIPGATANPNNIFISGPTGSGSPSAIGATLCAASKGTNIFCARIATPGGDVTYSKSSTTTGAAAGGTFTSNGWN